ncbi:two-component system CheB/CheR fusion protein [Silvibacterium bohemicum]|uniref:protein-glutamate O-methyltransferase n=2 Tax=Silvibacterium bohemicum TaxID=1577686 RepID=A0A841JP68_9BACT|nr:two-component system CheB/CheR fusion protein [Silvibacterium bohemicum]
MDEMSEQELREQKNGAGPVQERFLEAVASEPEEDADWHHPMGEDAAQSIGVSIEASATVEWNEENQNAALPYPVVGIGASAGGLQAFRELLEGLPEKTGMSYVIISHLAADQRSYLTEILARHTSMHVQTIEEGLQPQPDNLYVLPPGQIAFLEKGFFHVEFRDVAERIHYPVDDFFRSLASDQKSYSIGIILSGADGDGTLGVKAIKGEGGLSLAQSPETAEHSSMPLSSIEMDHVDFVASPREIGVELGRLAHLFAAPQIRSLEGGEPIPSQEQSLQRVLQLLRNGTGLDLRQYKPETIRRRIARRMVVRRVESLNDYARLLQLRPDEVRTLHEDVLINVTRFFRDPEFWLSLSTHVLPTFFQNRSAEKPVRVWCAGCATGEEAYSLAITVLEYLTANGLDTTVQIFGTDVSEYAVESARTAIYPDSLMGEMSAERLRRFFVKVDRGYQVSKRVRDCCIFARQNLANDPPFSHIDLLSCRNVIIYFNQSLQKQVITTFHYSLEQDGYLLLGMSESLRDYGDFFNAFDRKNKIYSKIGGMISSGHRFPQAFRANLLPSSMRMGEFSTLQAEAWSELELQRAADRIVLARYAPPGLIVDDHLRVLQARGQTAPYVELTPGAVSWSLSRVLRDEIAAEVKAAVERAIRENVPIVVSSSITTDDDDNETVNIEVLPITSASARTRCFLVLFSRNREPNRERIIDQIVLPELTGDGKERIIGQLRQDLTSTKFHLQSLVEERDARNQELVSANEEIQSANEELQSTNEELETTKEELQSANEELQTVNEELQQRNAILTQTGNDLTNLLNSVNMPLLMLTEDLKIRQFTPPMEKLLSIRAADIGRSISEIRLQLSVNDIEPILEDVLDTLGTREIEVQDRENKWHLLRVRPYRTAENKIEGLVVLLVDIDQLRSSQQELRDTRDFANSVMQSVPVAVVVLEQDCSIRTVNKAFREMSQMKDSELTGRSMPDLVSLLWGVNDFKKRLEELPRAESGSVLEFEHRSTTAQAKILLIKGQSLPVDGHRVLLLTLEDITLRRRAEQEITQQQEALQTEVEIKSKTLARAQDELRELAAHLFTMQEDERQRVARELHDDVSQRLTMLEMLCAKLEETGGSELPVIRQEVRSLNSDVREISHRLHPAILSDLGLPQAIKALVEDFRQRESMPATYFDTGVSGEIPPAIATALYRITQEALRNVSKHAGGTHVKVELNQVDGTLRLQVRDFGIGFDQDSEFPSRGLGLISMEERARIAGGTFSIASALGDGTKIAVEIPLEAHA